MTGPDLRARLHDLASEAPPGLEVPPGLIPRARRRVAVTLTGLAALIVVVAFIAVAGIRAIPDRREFIDPTPTPTRIDDGAVGIDWASVPGVHVDEDAFVDVRTGEVSPLPESIATLEPEAFAVAPGGDVLLFEADAEGSWGRQIFVANTDGSGVRRLTDLPGGASEGSWSPDGTTIVALVDRAGDGRDVDLVLIDADTGATTTLTSELRFPVEPRFSADGQTVYYSMYAVGDNDVLAVPVGGGVPTPFLEPHPQYEDRYHASFAPDGSSIVYWGSRSEGNLGGPEIWLADADGTDGGPFVEDDSFSANANWSPDSTRISYINYSNDLIAVVDVASRTPTYSVRVGEGQNGSEAEWIDDHTLLVDV